MNTKHIQVSGEVLLKLPNAISIVGFEVVKGMDSKEHRAIEVVGSSGRTMFFCAETGEYLGDAE